MSGEDRVELEKRVAALVRVTNLNLVDLDLFNVGSVRRRLVLVCVVSCIDRVAVSWVALVELLLLI